MILQVPCLLPDQQPAFDWPELRDGERQTKMVYRFSYLPSGLFNRAQVRTAVARNTYVLPFYV